MRPTVSDEGYWEKAYWKVVPQLMEALASLAANPDKIDLDAAKIDLDAAWETGYHEGVRRASPATPRPEGLDVERLALALALASGDVDDLDLKVEWYMTPRELADIIAREYARLDLARQG